MMFWFGYIELFINPNGLTSNGYVLFPGKYASLRNIGSQAHLTTKTKLQFYTGTVDNENVHPNIIPHDSTLHEFSDSPLSGIIV